MKLLILLIIVSNLNAYYTYKPNINNGMDNKPKNIEDKILYLDRSTYHIGDEKIGGRSWNRLYGKCYSIRFKNDSQRGKYILKLDIFGLEVAKVFINKNDIGYIPKQKVQIGKKRPNYWSSNHWITIPSRKMRIGNNRLSICSYPVSSPEFRGDLDDFQIRDIRVIKKF